MDLLLPSVLAWVLFGIGCGVAANNKGRDVASWVGLGILLGPFGLLYIVLLPLAEKKAPLAELNTQGLAFGQMWDCPQCGTSNSRGKDVCYECGTKNIALMVSPQPELAPMPTETVCPLCLETIKVGALKCKHCGEMLAEPAKALI